MNQLQTVLERALGDQLSDFILSKPVSKEGIIKVRLRPLLKKDQLFLQAEEYTKTQVFHKNMTKEEALAYVQDRFPDQFLQLQAETTTESITALANKKGTVTVKTKRKSSPAPKITLEHNRKKQYILEEGQPIPFLVDLGVMTPEGRIVHARYDKFRQINRFLEFIEDILPHLPKDRELQIIDFGCGKSYLTFAMYHYLHECKGYPIRITGLDLKQDVIENCSRLAKTYGYDHLTFRHGDIATYEQNDQIDMVVTLHACDTATDHALAKAVRWGARVILSVPCCQHELNRQIQNDLLAPVLTYGILKERISALLTDGIRAQLLEQQGYRTQLLEFIDMEHTPKNLLIRAVYTGRPSGRTDELRRLTDALHVDPALVRLLQDQT